MTSAIHLTLCIVELIMSYSIIRLFARKQGANFFRLLQEEEHADNVVDGARGELKED